MQQKTTPVWLASHPHGQAKQFAPAAVRAQKTKQFGLEMAIWLLTTKARSGKMHSALIISLLIKRVTELSAPDDQGGRT